MVCPSFSYAFAPCSRCAQQSGYDTVLIPLVLVPTIPMFTLFVTLGVVWDTAGAVAYSVGSAFFVSVSLCRGGVPVIAPLASPDLTLFAGHLVDASCALACSRMCMRPPSLHETGLPADIERPCLTHATTVNLTTWSLRRCVCTLNGRSMRMRNHRAKGQCVTCTSLLNYVSTNVLCPRCFRRMPLLKLLPSSSPSVVYLRHYLGSHCSHLASPVPRLLL